MKVCGTKPPPKLSTAKSAASRRTIERERRSDAVDSSSSSCPTSTAGEKKVELRGVNLVKARSR